MELPKLALPYKATVMKSKPLFLILSLCLIVCTCTWWYVHAKVPAPTKATGAGYPWSWRYRLVDYLAGMMGTKLVSCARSVCVLNHWAFQAPGDSPKILAIHITKILIFWVYVEYILNIYIHIHMKNLDQSSVSKYKRQKQNN